MVFKVNEQLNMPCGTPMHVAPEVLDGEYDGKCDLWSFGVITFVLLSGQFPFKGKTLEGMFQNIQACNWVFDARWESVSADAKDFIRKLLVLNTQALMTAEEALQHPWVVGNAAVEASARSSGRLHDNVVHSLVEFAQASKFRRACFSVMAWGLAKEERAKVREA